MSFPHRPRRASVLGSAVSARNTSPTPMATSSRNGMPASGCSESTSGRLTSDAPTKAVPTATPANARSMPTCTRLGGVSTLPRHPHELMGFPDRSATTTTSAKARYDAATIAASTGLPVTSAPIATSASIAPPTRTRRLPHGSPRARSACAVSSGSSALSEPPSASTIVATANAPARTVIADAPYPRVRALPEHARRTDQVAQMPMRWARSSRW